MYRFSQSLLPVCRRHVHTVSHDSPSLTLRRKIVDANNFKKKRDPRKNQVYVKVPEGVEFLDTATTPMYIGVVGVAVIAKVLMMIDESYSQETLEKKIRNAPAGTGTVRMLSREEWENIRELRPRTPFESKLARPNARIRTDDPLHTEDLKDWTIDVLTDALTRAEETVRQNSK